LPSGGAEGVLTHRHLGGNERLTFVEGKVIGEVV